MFLPHSIISSPRKSLMATELFFHNTLMLPFCNILFCFFALLTVNFSLNQNNQLWCGFLAKKFLMRADGYEWRITSVGPYSHYPWNINQSNLMFMNTVSFCFENKFKLDFIAIPNHLWVFQIIDYWKWYFLLQNNTVYIDDLETPIDKIQWT